VYVTTFPAPGRKWQISVNGGYYPAWRADGKEIYYQGPNRRVMAVAVKTEPTFEAGDPHVLFENPGSNFDVTADGQRFLVGVPAREAPPAPIIVVLNWQAGLKK
jgi:hypothetical protein